MERVYQKLVRDKIPQIIEGNGETPVTRTLVEADYQMELEKKLLEECNEVVEAHGEDRLEELADVLEIIRAMAKLEGKTVEDILQLANQKSEKRGAFEKRIFLEKVIEKNSIFFY